MELVDQFLTGNRRALARVISRVEDDGPDVPELLAALYPHTGHAHIVGVTGAPGTGKSTLVNSLARAYRAQGRTIGIIAVDPTSPFSGGALLGDRVRMRDLSGDAGIFIRSMATRGSLGGLAHATGSVVLVLDAAGFDRILIETVGVGQAEVDIAGAAHTTVVVESPGMGDEIQAIKAGVLEIADLFVVNKADRDGADHTVMALQMMQGLGRSTGHHGTASVASGASRARFVPGEQPDGSWLPPITKTVATHGDGVEALRDWIETHCGYLKRSGRLAQREVGRAASALNHILRDALMDMLLERLPDGRLPLEIIDQVAQRSLDPYTAAARLLAEPGPCGPTPSPRPLPD